MTPWSLDQVRAILNAAVRNGPPLMGVGERAFPRLGPALLLDDYQILCALQTADLSDLRGLAPVHCLQEALGAPAPSARDTLSILSHPALRTLGYGPRAGTRLVIYRETPQLSMLAHAQGWHLLAAPHSVRARWENKAWFRRRLRQAALAALDCDTVPLDEFHLSRYREWQRRWGPHLVIQIPDFPRGGGRSTFFVQDEDEFRGLGERLKQGRHRGHPVSQLLVSPHVHGPSLSIVGCAGPWGVLLSPVQTQLLDLPELMPPGHEGRFCGHQWGPLPYAAETVASARALCLWVGEALGSEGYRGIFGIDFALDEEKQRLYALECNPRYTGALPTLTLLQMATGHPPMEALHLLALLEDPTPVSVAALNDAAQDMPAASQILLFHRGPGPGMVRGTLRSGQYVWSDHTDAPRWVAPLFPFPSPPWGSQAFAVIDGPPIFGTPLLPGESLDRVVRILFFRHILKGATSLDNKAAAVIRWAYQSLGLDQGEGDGR